MKKSKKWLSLLISLSLSATLLAACGGNTTPTTSTAPGTSGSATETEGSETDAPTESETEGESSDTSEEPGNEVDVPLVVGYSAFSGKFSPYFADTAYDQDVVSMTQVSLLTTDRLGGVIMNAIEGETVPYAGTDYEYTGISNLEIERTDDTTTYNFQLREGVLFSDGEEMTADDVIFNLYAYLDPSYVGSNTLQSLPIQGLQEYRTQSSPEIATKYAALFDSVYEAGRDHAWSDADAWTQEQQDSVWALVDEQWNFTISGIIDYVTNNYGARSLELMGVETETLKETEGLQVAYGAYVWGFADYGPEIGEGESTAAEGAPNVFSMNGKEFDLEAGEYPTREDYYETTFAAYEGDAQEFYGVENAGTADLVYTAKQAFITEWGPKDEDSESTFPNISGIVKHDDYNVSVTLNGFDASAIYKLGVTVAPLHYYGDEALYDYDNNQFGFEFNQLDATLRAGSKADVPMGAGPYVFQEYVNKVVEYNANEHYWRGEPKTKIVQFREVNEPDKTTGIATGVLDVTDPTFNVTVVDEIMQHNSDTGELSGSVITTSTVDNLGYGYIGINADTVKVGEEPGSEESKNLRKAIATVLATYRELAVSTYYGERASVINYPISNTSWAAPQETDEGYAIAYSTDAEGNPIYTSDMEPEDRYEAALDAAVTFFVAAGYTFDEASGKLTAAPEGAKLEYEVIVPAEGSGNHPAFQILSETSVAFEKIGFTFRINDPADSNVLWDSLDAGTQELWAAAWGATIDPDMYQVYHSSNIVGLPNASESNHYHIADEELDQLIMDARTSDDQEFRKATYKAALDVILDWGVEIPTYQRLNAVIFSTERINLDTLTPDITTFWGWMNDIELLEMNPEA